MDFKSCLQDDLKDIFFNTDEFAEIHTLGGREVPLIIDDDELKARQLKVAEGIYLGELLIYVGAEHFNRRPIEGRQMKLDDEIYFVVSCAEKDGMYEITLGANES